MPPDRFFTCVCAPLRQLDRLEQLVDQPLALGARHAVQLGEDDQVLLDAQLEVAGHRLRDDADRLAHAVGLLDDVEAVDRARCPTVGGSSVVSMRISVDLPAPFGPSRPKISPSSTAKLMPLTAVKSPNFLTMLLDVDGVHGRR